MQQTFTVTSWPRQNYSFLLEPAISNYLWTFYLPKEMQHFIFYISKKKKKCYDVIFTVITFPVIAWIFFMEWKTSILRRMKVLDSSLQALGGMNAVCLFPIVYSFFSFSFSFCSVLTGASVLLPNLRPSSFSTWHEIAVVMLSDKSMNQCLNLSCWTLRNPTWILWFILQHMPNKNEMPVMMLH